VIKAMEHLRCNCWSVQGATWPNQAESNVLRHLRLTGGNFHHRQKRGRMLWLYSSAF